MKKFFLCTTDIGVGKHAHIHSKQTVMCSSQNITTVNVYKCNTVNNSDISVFWNKQKGHCLRNYLASINLQVMKVFLQPEHEFGKITFFSGDVRHD